MGHQYEVAYTRDNPKLYSAFLAQNRMVTHVLAETTKVKTILLKEKKIASSESRTADTTYRRKEEGERKCCEFKRCTLTRFDVTQVTQVLCYDKHGCFSWENVFGPPQKPWLSTEKNQKALALLGLASGPLQML